MDGRMIAFYMKESDGRLQRSFLEIVRWVRRLCPHVPVSLFYHPHGAPELADLDEVDIQPLSIAPSSQGDNLSEAVAATISRTAPRIIHWGPDPAIAIHDYTPDRQHSLMSFSTHIQSQFGGREKRAGSVLTLIHGDPNPTEPRLKPIGSEWHNRIFTGSVQLNDDNKTSPWPIHSRGAEVTANFLKNILWGRPLSSDAFLYPVIAMIEPTRRCNLSCPMCPVGGNQTYRAKDMPFDRFQKIIDELKPFLVHLTLHNYGESFLHSDIYRMIGYAKKEGIPDVNISTNGHLLDPTRLIDSDLDEIMISLDGITQETYATYRKGGRLDRVVKNIRALDREKRKRKTKKPLMELQFIIMKHNQSEMDGFRELATDFGADRIRFKTFNLQMSGPKQRVSGIEFLPTQLEYTRYADGRGRILKRNLEENRCKWPWERVVINTDGHVVPCCNDFDSHYSMGNVFDQPFPDIWFGPKYNRFRTRILKGLRNVPLCTNCPVPNFADLSFERVARGQR